MGNNIVPLKIKGIEQSIYAGFWLRLGAFILDTIIFIPINIFLLQFESDAYYYLYECIAFFVVFYCLEFFFLR